MTSNRRSAQTRFVAIPTGLTQTPARNFNCTLLDDQVHQSIDTQDLHAASEDSLLLLHPALDRRLDYGWDITGNCKNAHMPVWSFAKLDVA